MEEKKKHPASWTVFFPKKELQMAVFVAGWDYYTVEK